MRCLALREPGTQRETDSESRGRDGVRGVRGLQGDPRRCRAVSRIDSGTRCDAAQPPSANMPRPPFWPVLAWGQRAQRRGWSWTSAERLPQAGTSDLGWGPIFHHLVSSASPHRLPWPSAPPLPSPCRTLDAPLPPIPPAPYVPNAMTSLTCCHLSLPHMSLSSWHSKPLPSLALPLCVT